MILGYLKSMFLSILFSYKYRYCKGMLLQKLVYSLKRTLGNMRYMRKYLQDDANKNFNTFEDIFSYI